MNWKTLSTTALVGVLLASAGQAADLRIALQDDPDLLDPAQSRSFTGRIVYASLCDKLVDVNENVEFVPQLATDWAFSEDGLTLVMNLRQGVTFHDGEAFNAEAVLYTLNRNMNLPESKRKSELSSIASMEATGEHQVTFTLKQPDVSLIGQLSDRAGMIVSPKAAEAAGAAEFANHPVCAGPYEFVERIAQDRIVLKKFDAHWNAENFHFDTLTFLPIPDTTVRLANLRSGDVQLVDRVAPTDAATVQADASLGYAESVGLGNMGIYINVGNKEGAKAPLGENQALREAFSLAIDREAIMNVVYAGAALPGNQPWPPTSPWYNEALPVLPRDGAKARELVTAAGFDRIPVEIKHGNNPVTAQAMQMIQAMVAEAGFDVTLKATEFATLLDEQTNGNYNVSRSDWSGRPDPDGNVNQFYVTGGGLNDPGYSNPEVDALLAAARAEADPAKRKEIYAKFVEITNHDLSIVYIGHQKFIYGFTDKLNGFQAYPDAMLRLAGVSLAE